MCPHYSLFFMKRLLLLNFKNFEFMTFHPSCINDIQIFLYNSSLKHPTHYVCLLHIQNLYNFCITSSNYQIITDLSILIEKIFYSKSNNGNASLPLFVKCYRSTGKCFKSIAISVFANKACASFNNSLYISP